MRLRQAIMNIEPKDAWIALDDRGEVGITCVVVKDKVILNNKFNRIELSLDQVVELYAWLNEWSISQTVPK